MGFKFRRSIKIAPGVKLNVGKKGLSSVSIGGTGASVNVGGKRGAKATLGGGIIPGASVEVPLSGSKRQRSQGPGVLAKAIGCAVLLAFCLIVAVVVTIVLAR